MVKIFAVKCLSPIKRRRGPGGVRAFAASPLNDGVQATICAVSACSAETTRMKGKRIIVLIGASSVNDDDIVVMRAPQALDALRKIKARTFRPALSLRMLRVG